MIKVTKSLGCGVFPPTTKEILRKYSGIFIVETKEIKKLEQIWMIIIVLYYIMGGQDPQ